MQYRSHRPCWDQLAPSPHPACTIPLRLPHPQLLQEREPCRTVLCCSQQHSSLLSWGSTGTGAQPHADRK